jgi:acetyl-CoA hydrolase/succinyl-CoA:acetate CoA-transferase
MHPEIQAKLITAEEAAGLIVNGEVLGCSGFTPSGYPKVVPAALAERGKKILESGREFGVSVYTGASVGDELDGTLARAGIMKARTPYQSHKDIREGINNGSIEFFDLHLSHVAQQVRHGFLKKPTTAIIEAVDVTQNGKVYLAGSGGVSATYMMMADRIIIELNHFYGKGLKGIHDVYIPEETGRRRPLPIYTPADRLGTPYVQVPLEKIVGIVETNLPDSMGNLVAPDADSLAIARHIMEFLSHEKRKGRLPHGLPYQSGVGNVANAVLSCMAHDDALDSVSLYTEVIQDSIFELIDAGKLNVASGCSLTLSKAGQNRFISQIDELRPKFVLRQQEISNNPEIIRRLGTISMNTALEFDIFGNVNSTHVMGSKMMNGIGGSGDFTRNAYLPIFMTTSIAKGGKISSIVPMVTHVDHNEHSTQIFVTEQGLADVRGMSPVKRARAIIEKCAHPMYKDMLTEYLDYGLKHAPSKHTPQVLDRAFEMHLRLAQTGTMQA